MNKFIAIGRLYNEPEVRYAQNNNNLAIARYGIAINRVHKKEGEPDADFLNCVAFGKNAEFAEKYLHKGMKIGITGHIQTGSYTNKDGQKVYTTDVVVDEQEFCESKNAGTTEEPKQESNVADNGFVSAIDAELPFN